ncbi:FG-GAP-like repeat-containing protein [Actinoplanes rectilineatus]|uniref:FG-GAP-like repeat-containing protein n=1 Tax=Actinoplanes rectilineatus TaxID=113571 RepID=UPI0005F2797C|nr:FG-GAP-like repeat-containing protein [Actinoplanes rectilineatus]
MRPLSLLAALLAAAVLLPAAPAQAADTAAAPLRVMPLGDSITRGTGSDPIYGYRNRLWNLVSQQDQYTIDYVGSVTSDAAMADMDHEGHRGWTTVQLRAEIDAWMDAQQPDVVLLHAGINDLNREGVSGETAVNRLDDLVNRIIFNRPSVTIVLSGLIPVSTGLQDKVAVVNAGARTIAAKEVAEGNKVRYVDMPLTASQMADDLHPNNSGYVTMADAYFGALSKVVADGWARGPYDSFNGDARADLVVHTGTDLTVRKGVSTGGFDAGSSVSSGWGRYHGLDVTDGLGRLHYADFDGDSRTDLIVHDGSDIYVRLNTGTGFDGGRLVSSGWGRYHGLQVSNGLGRLYFADYDGDGRDDLIVHDGSDVTVRLNTGTGGFDSGRLVTTGYGRYHGLQVSNGLGRLYFADYDGDGRDDLIVHDGTDVTVRLNTGTGGFDSGRLVTTGYGRYHGLQVSNGLGRLYFADYNGDGRDDLVIHDGTNVDVRLTKAGGGFEAVRTVTTGYGRYHGLQLTDGLGRLYFA